MERLVAGKRWWRDAVVDNRERISVVGKNVRALNRKPTLRRRSTEGELL